MKASQEEVVYDENESVEGRKTQQGHEDNAETMSSNGSDNGKGSGSGSGGGYSADCSSSDASSNDAAKRSPLVLENELQQLRVGDIEKKTKSNENRGKKSRSSSRSTLSALKICALAGGDFPRVSKAGDKSGIANPSMAQWNGVRIHHPMDPRIDISTVGHIQTSSLSVFPVDVHNGENNNNHEAGQSQASANHPPPSVDQYMALMEVVRPFFHAHGIANPTDEIRGTEVIKSSAKQQQNATTRANEVQHFMHENGEVDTMRNADDMVDTTRPNSPTSTDSDGSSMVVLARVKRKHLRNKSSGDPENDETNTSSNVGSNVSSVISSDRRVQHQYPEQPSRRGQLEHREVDVQQLPHDHVDEAEMERHHARAGQDSSSTSASSSRGQNNANIPVDAPLGIGGGGVPAVVSEYASSRVGSSGSNTHQTSSSGSARNTGSGTGSGSNQGGSSGSGNDQGGMYSNGVGSSGSGNDLKGSSEEARDNCGANNSGEGNSDESNSNGKPGVGGEPTHTLIHPVREPENPTKSTNAFREKKLIDKKRKRMNMRREYEEKVQQEMESSEGSDENESMKPGRPVTLDKVLSLTKKARIVVNASPPFLVVHTNAGYCRLSGIDSHTVVGKPVSDFLSIPDPQTLDQVKAKHLQPPEIPRADEVDDFACTHDGIILLHPAENTEGLTAAEAAGRARAAASQEDSLDRLVAASGFGQYHVINLSAKPLDDPSFGISKSLEAPAHARNREEGSKGSSITSSLESCLQVTCSMSISPVVSSPEAFTVVTDKDMESHHHHHNHKSKRRKYHANETASSSTASHHPPTRRSFPHREVIVSRKRQLITHYVIQLEPIDEYRKPGSANSSGSGSESSTPPAMEAQLFGVTNSQILGQQELDPRIASMERQMSNHPERDANEQNDEDEMDSESSNPHDCVVAIG